MYETPSFKKAKKKLNMETTDNKNKATLLHLSALSQYVFPFGNFIFPLILWSSMKEKATYIDQQGKQVLNFQLSLFIYSLILVLIAVPIFIATVVNGISISDSINLNHFEINSFHLENVSGLVLIALFAAFLFFTIKIAEFFLIIYAAVKTANGDDFKYPLTIHFIK